MAFKERIKSLRKEHGLTMKEASQLIGCPMGTYVNWEYGRVYPKPSSVKKIAGAFDVTERWLETGLGEKSREEEEKKIEEAKERKVMENRVVYRKEDKDELEGINLCIRYLPTMQCTRNEKRQIHAVLSKYRGELEGKVLFGIGDVKEG